MNRVFGNFTGAFADGAILFPLIIILSNINGFSLGVLLLSAGVIYFISGFVFRIPISVQPLKSVAIAAIALGASMVEVRLSGFLLGAILLSFTIVDVNSFAKRIPRSIIHGIQLSLGIILILKGFESGLKPFSNLNLFLLIISVGLVLFFSGKSIPILGAIAVGGFILALRGSGRVEPIVSTNNSILRLSMILYLVIPQLILTSANSVVATADVARHYFGDQSKLVTPKRLLTSIGIGNILSSLIGGLPFCHGSGGLTAHYRGGARDWWSNLIIGFALIILATVEFYVGGLGIYYPSFLLGLLLIFTGVFHIKLAAPTWNLKSERLRLIAMGIVTVLTQNLLWAIIVGILPELDRFMPLKLSRRVS